VYDTGSGKIAAPLSRYAPFRRAGDLVYFSGIIAVDHSNRQVIKGYSDLPVDARRLAGETGEMSSDMKDGPIAAQSWWILNSLRLTVEAAGGTLNDVVKLTQFFRNLRDFPLRFSKIRRRARSFRYRSCYQRRTRCLRSRRSRISRLGELGNLADRANDQIRSLVF